VGECDHQEEQKEQQMLVRTNNSNNHVQVHAGHGSHGYVDNGNGNHVDRKKFKYSRATNTRYSVVNGNAGSSYGCFSSSESQDFIEREWRDNCSHKCNVTTTELAQDFTNSNMEHGHQKYAEESDETRPNDPEDSRSHHVPSYWECFSTFCQQTILHGWHYLTAEAASTSTPSTPACCRCCTCDNCRAPPRTSLLDYSLTNLSESETFRSSSQSHSVPPCSISQQSHHSRTFNNSHYSHLPHQMKSKSDSNVYRSVFWSIIVFASVVSGGFFLHDNTSEFLKSTVQTTLDSMVPLSQVLFPSVVVCNINQIRKSLFNELGFYDNETLVRIMYEDFIKGTKDNSENSTYLGSEFEDDEHHSVKRKEFYQVLRNYLISKNISVNKSIIWLSHQNCDDMFIYSKWNSSTTYTHGENKRDFGTDYGICCWYTPQLNFSAIPWGEDTDWNYWFGTVKKGAKTGKENGFSVLFDIESFDYGYYDEGSEGLKVAIVHHLDMPIMRQRAFHIAPGTENQIPITPTLYTANPQVLTRFTPEQRDCYQEHEIDLKYLPKSHGYRYEMSNCLFEAAFEKILEDCKCAPGFHNEGGADAMDTYEVCTGADLACSNEILNRMGQYNKEMNAK